MARNIMDILSSTHFIVMKVVSSHSKMLSKRKIQLALKELQSLLIVDGFQLNLRIKEADLMRLIAAS
jgi:hypothetical protein